MVVEAAVRHPGRRHELGDADAVETLLAEQLRRRLDHARAVLRGSLLRDAHLGSIRPLDYDDDYHHKAAHSRKEATRCSPRLFRGGSQGAACITVGWSSRSTFLVALTTAGAMGLPGALLRPLQREFGWSEADISSALALRILLFGLMAPFAAALIERYGLKRVILSAIALIAAGLSPRCS